MNSKRIAMIGRRALLAITLALASHSAASDAIRMSESAERVREALTKAERDTTHAVVLDAPQFSLKSAVSVLDAIAQARAAGARVFAVCPATPGGAVDGTAAIALACDGIALVKGGEIAGAGPAWTIDAARRDEIRSLVLTLTAVDPLLAERLLDASGALSWSRREGYAANANNDVKLASPGQPIKFAIDTLKRLGLEAKQYDSLDAAIAAANGGKVPQRTRRPKESEGAGGLTAPSTPTSPSTPAGGRAPQPQTPAPTPAAPAAPAPATADVAAKLAPKLGEYAAALAELKAKLKEFEEYYRGRRGIWTTQHKSLRAIWDAEADMTRHADTKTTTERLQRDMNRLMSRLDSAAKFIERIAKDMQHPEVVRVRANAEKIKGLRAAFQRNKTSNYEQYSNQVLGMN